MMPAARTSLCAVILVSAVAFAAAENARAQEAVISFDEPSLDRWMYPFNFTPGARPEISAFGALGDARFDDRDGQFLIGFDTQEQLDPGAGESNYQVRSAVVRVTTTVGGFVYDDTYDSYVAYLDELDPEFVADSDPGRPLELYGVGYRGLFSQATFLENSPFASMPVDPINPMANSVRNAFPIETADPASEDISNNVRQRFDVTPFAVGALSATAPGSITPVEAEFEFELDLTNPEVVAYLRRGLNDGRLRFIISSLHPAVQQGGEFVEFFAKENLAGFGVTGELEIAVCVGKFADVDCDGIVGPSDLGVLLGSWGTDFPPADLTGDGVVDAQDLAFLLGSWG